MKKKEQFILILVFIAIIWGIGFAYLSTTLHINGTTTIDSNNWNIYFDNLQVSTGSVEAEELAIDASNTTVSFSVNLKKPGDYYEFIVDAKNDGTIDAMINDFTSTLNNTPITTLPDYIEYKVTYIDEMEIQTKHKLESNKKDSFLVRVAFKKDIDDTQLLENATTLNFNFSMNYIQADNQSFTRNRYVYDAEDLDFELGNSIPSGATVFKNSYDITRSLNYGVFLRHLVDANNIILKADIGYNVKEDIVYFYGGVEDEEAFQSNYSNIQRYSTNCTVYGNGAACTDGFIERSGYIYIATEYAACTVTTGGYSSCYIQ